MHRVVARNKPQDRKEDVGIYEDKLMGKGRRNDDRKESEKACMIVGSQWDDGNGT